MNTVTARERLEEALRTHGSREQQKGSWTCPAHEDKRASMTVADGKDGRVLIHCHAGCETNRVVEALGLTLADLQPPDTGHNGNGTHRPNRPEIVATYDYLDENGVLLFQVCRMNPKDFRQRRPDPSERSGWAWTTKGVRRVPYHLPELITAVKSGRRVWVVEGEKDVHALERAGEVATCNPAGAKKWDQSYNQHFHGADVIIVRDQDETGHEHAEQVHGHLQTVARTVLIVDPATGKDAADHLSEGLGVDKFLGLNPPTPPRATTYRSGAELFDAAPEHPEWVWHGYLARSAVTLLAGRHKGGKSTLLFGLIRALVDGHHTFLNHTVAPSPIVLLTEEAPSTLRSKLEPITRDGMQQIRVLCRDDITPNRPSWETSVREAGQEAVEHGANTIIIDTFAFWSQITDENDSAIMQNAVAVLAELTAQNLAVIVVHHHRKGATTEIGDAIRGSTALQGAVDLIVELFRVDDDDTDTSTQRELRAIGRYPEIPEAMRVKLETDGVYRTIVEGTRAEVEHHTWRERVTSYLVDNYAMTHTQATIRDALGADPKHKGAIADALRRLQNEGHVERVGIGGRPAYRWILKQP